MTIDATFWIAISFFIFFAILIYLKVPQKINNSLTDKINEIQKELEEAEKLKEEAKNLFADYENKIDKSKKETKEIIDSAKKESEKAIIEKTKKFHQIIEERKKSTEQKIVQMKENALKDIKNISVKISIEAVENLIKNSIDKNKLENLYNKSLEQAKIAKYDIEVLEHRFQTSFEQVCHRLTTIHKPGNRGIPFHLMRVDIAGNISKRFSSSGITIPRYSGACPRLNIYSAFTTPGKVKVQISEMPDGEKYFCLARAFSKRGGSFSTPESYYSIGLGCGLSEAKDMIYSENILLDAIKNAVPVGISCRTCPRTDCSQRAFPPNDRALIFDENIRGISSYVTPI